MASYDFVKIIPFPLFWMTGKDIFIDGKGNFQVKLLLLFTIADAKDKEIDEDLLRWLAESIPCFFDSIFIEKA